MRRDIILYALSLKLLIRQFSTSEHMFSNHSSFALLASLFTMFLYFLYSIFSICYSIFILSPCFYELTSYNNFQVCHSWTNMNLLNLNRVSNKHADILLLAYNTYFIIVYRFSKDLLRILCRSLELSQIYIFLTFLLKSKLNLKKVIHRVL